MLMSRALKLLLSCPFTLVLAIDIERNNVLGVLVNSSVFYLKARIKIVNAFQYCSLMTLSLQTKIIAAANYLFP